jgi:hypothetical protein
LGVLAFGLLCWGVDTVSVSLGEVAGPSGLKVASHVAVFGCLAVVKGCCDEGCAACHLHFHCFECRTSLGGFDTVHVSC